MIRPLPLILTLALTGAGLSFLFGQRKLAPQTATQGALYVIGDQQPCPLKHTAVEADISGPLARVRVTQEFENPLNEAIEAVYVFPLPRRAAVDDMTLHVGDQVIRGKIKPRDEARKIYEQAKAQGKLAGLLDQERPNIFTQSVTNIGAGMKVKVIISYVETLPYEAGQYEFSFPMVVGPRYQPKSGVADAERISPPVTPPGTRAGHDLSLKVNLDAGVGLESIASKTHEVDIRRTGTSKAVIELKNKAVLPNKDFILNYDVAGAKVADALLTHKADRGGFFTFLLQPPDRVKSSEITPKELVFVLDTSGSMSGFPIEKSKEVIKLAMDGLNPKDTFNLITFAGSTSVLFPQPVPATEENVQKAQRFLLSRSGGGGTEMMKAIRTALDPSDSQEHVRIVCFLTDGYVGNDMEILAEIRRHPNARIFSFGVGSSVNRFLLDKMAEESRGEVEYVGLNEDGSAAAKKFHERVHSPLLTDISIDWGGLAVSDVYPARIPDLFTAKPLVLTGRYLSPGKGSVRITGKMAGREFVRTVPVDLPGSQPAHDVLATLWARTRVDDLMSQDWSGMQNGNPKPELRNEITRLGVKYGLMTQFTSFVAVSEETVVENGKVRRIDVPVEMPHGVSYEGIFGSRDEAGKIVPLAHSPAIALPYRASEQGALNRAKAIRTEPEARERKIDVSLTDRASRADTEKVDVKIWLTNAGKEVIDSLKKMGVEIKEIKPGKLVLAKVSRNLLEALGKMPEVLYVSEDLGVPK